MIKTKVTMGPSRPKMAHSSMQHNEHLMQRFSQTQQQNSSMQPLTVTSMKMIADKGDQQKATEVVAKHQPCRGRHR